VQLLRLAPTMAIHDYDIDATELLETYGWCHFVVWLALLELNGCSDFLMKYIIIGLWCRSKALSCLTNSTGPLTGEAGTGKSCLLHHFTHNSCECLLVNHIQVVLSGMAVRSQRSFATYHRSGILEQHCQARREANQVAGDLFLGRASGGPDGLCSVALGHSWARTISVRRTAANLDHDGLGRADASIEDL
jgi:hypothetical protein